VVVRGRLLDQLVEARRRRCIVVTGPAGSGKTTLLGSLRQALVPLGFDVAWLSFAPIDNDVTRFLERLVAGVGELAPAIVGEAALLASGNAEPQAVERLTVALVRGIARHRRELVLVMDDVHHLTQPAIVEALQWLLDFAPLNLHLVLASRGAHALSLERLRSEGQTLELGPTELRFSLSETAQLLQAATGGADPREVRVLHELTDGWAAGLHLYLLDAKRVQAASGGQASPAKQGVVPLRNARAFTHYFELEVLARLEPHEVDLLTAVAPCNRFCAALCNTLLGLPAMASEAMATLQRLERDQLFVVALEEGDQERWFRLHPLLRETLLARFATLDEARQREVHSRAWVWFRDRGHSDEAVRHAIQAGEAGLAAAFVEACASTLFLRGEKGKLISLLRLLPDDQVVGNHALSLWKARSQLYLREFDACNRTLERLESETPALDASRQFPLALLRTTLAVQRDDLEGALKQLPRLLAAPENADPIALGGRRNILSWLYLHQGRHEEARGIQVAGPPLLVNGAPLLSTAAGSLQGRCLIGLSHALEGQMVQAERIYRAVAAEARQGGKACADAYYLAIALLAEVLYELDDAQQARALLEDKVDVLERITIPDAVLRVLRVLSAAHWQLGQRMESFAYLERLEEYAVHDGLDRLLAYSLCDQARRRLLLGETIAAGAALARLEEVAARHPDAIDGTSGEIGMLVERARIGQLVSQGDIGDAAARLATLIASCEDHRRHRVAAHMLVVSAAVDAQRGLVDASQRKTLEALRRGHRLGLLRSLLDADPAARDLIASAAANGSLDPVLAFYVERLLAGRRKTPQAAPGVRTAALLATAAEPLNDREIQVLRLLAQAMPNKKIARALDLSPQTVKWYLSRIYGKLGVAGRDEAVARMRDSESKL
jgi:LuxR family maltose regulon positive regulatory protein